MKKTLLLALLSIIGLALPMHASNWYIVGQFNEWSANPSYRFSVNDKGTLDIDIPMLAGDFLIVMDDEEGNLDWNTKIGANASSAIVEPDVPYFFGASSEASNMAVAPPLMNVHIEFDLLGFIVISGDRADNVVTWQVFCSMDTQYDWVAIDMVNTIDDTWEASFSITQTNAAIVIRSLINGIPDKYYGNNMAWLPMDEPILLTEMSQGNIATAPGNYTLRWSANSFTLTTVAFEGDEYGGDEDDFDPDNMYVYFDNSLVLWTTPRFYYWSDQTKPIVWPGSLMTHVENNIWRASFPIEYPYVVFNGVEGKTEDITAQSFHLYQQTPDGLLIDLGSYDRWGQNYFEQEEYTVEVGATTLVTAFNSVDEVITMGTFTVEDEGIATIDNQGNVTGIAVGTTTIYCTFQGKTVTTTLNVTCEVTSLTLDFNEVTLRPGEQVTVRAVGAPAACVLDQAEWTSDDCSIATVELLDKISEGNVSAATITAVAEGSSVVTISIGNISAKCRVNVVDESKVTTLYYDNSFTKWAEVKIYYWNENDNPVNWPGVLMENIGEEIWQFSIPANYKNLIFDNGYTDNAWQTEDLKAVAGHVYKISDGDRGKDLGKFFGVGVIPGDLDGDNKVTISDAQIVINLMLNPGSDGVDADFDDDNKVTISDAQMIINWMLN